MVQMSTKRTFLFFSLTNLLGNVVVPLYHASEDGQSAKV